MPGTSSWLLTDRWHREHRAYFAMEGAGKRSEDDWREEVVDRESVVLPGELAVRRACCDEEEVRLVEAVCGNAARVWSWRKFAAAMMAEVGLQIARCWLWCCGEVWRGNFFFVGG